jgi:hypothetical protein
VAVRQGSALRLLLGRRQARQADPRPATRQRGRRPRTQGSPRRAAEPRPAVVRTAGSSRRPGNWRRWPDRHQGRPTAAVRCPGHPIRPARPAARFALPAGIGRVWPAAWHPRSVALGRSRDGRSLAGEGSGRTVSPAEPTRASGDRRMPAVAWPRRTSRGSWQCSSANSAVMDNSDPRRIPRKRQAPRTQPPSARRMSAPVCHQRGPQPVTVTVLASSTS